MRLSVVAAAIACLAGALPATAQTKAAQPQETHRFFVTIGGGAQISKNTLDRDTAPTFYAEPASVHQHFRIPAGARVEFGGGMRFSQIEIGGSFGFGRENGVLDVTAGIPHPFFFGQFRPAALSDRARRTVVDVNIDFMVRLFRWGRTTVSLGAGPTYTSLTQTIETALNIADVYPYDTVTIQSFVMSTVKGRGVGGHVLGSVSYPLRRGLLATGIVRYTAVKATTPMETGAADVRWQVGGLQGIASIRFLF